MANARITPTNPNSINSQSNPGQSAASVGRMSNYGVVRSATNQLREGDVVRGEISDLRNNEITVTLENNTILKGQINDSSSLSIGQRAAFRLDTISPSRIALQILPKSISESEITMINKALSEAGLPPTDHNQQAVKALMDNLLPINKQSIQQLMQRAYDIGTQDMDTLCLMKSQGMHITPDSVIQFSNYRNNQYQLLNQIQNFAQNLPDLLDTLAASGPSSIVSQFGSSLLSMLLMDSATSDMVQQPSTLQSLSEEQREQILNMLSETPLSDSMLQQLQSGTLSLQDTLSLIHDAATQGTLYLEEPVSLEQLAAKMQEISTTLEPVSREDISPDITLYHYLTADTPEDRESASLDTLETEPAVSTSTDHTESGNINGALSFAGKLFHNIRDSAKNSIQNLNQILTTTSNVSQQHLPDILDTLISKVYSQGRTYDSLFTYLSPDQRNSLSQVLEHFPMKDNLRVQIANGQAGTKEVFTVIRNLIPLTDSYQVQNLFQNESFQKLFSQTLLSNLTITPDQLKQPGKMDSFYQRMEKQMDSMESLIRSTLSGSDAGQLSDQAHNMKSNIEFMKALNDNLGFLQLPLKLQNQDAHGELYVYTQKEKRRQHPEQLSVLLHLDMDSLGTLDVRIEKDHNQVKTNFFLDNEPALRLIKTNVSMLENALNQQGYTCQIQVQTQKQDTSPIQQFLSTKVTPGTTNEMKRFSFDIRA